MKVYLPAIEGHVPQDIIRCFQAFLEFCYIVRQDIIAEDTLLQLSDCLGCFHRYRQIFQDTSIRFDGFSLPRQHALCHYSMLIRLFGAPNGICSSITESKHIKAVKEPWRHSSKFNALGQMLLTNQRLDKLAASRSDFTARRMLDDSFVLDHLEYLGTSSTCYNKCILIWMHTRPARVCTEQRRHAGASGNRPQNDKFLHSFICSKICIISIIIVSCMKMLYIPGLTWMKPAKSTTMTV